MLWPPERIDTARLCLRKPLAYDAEPLFASLCGDPEVTRFLGWVTHTKLQETRQQIIYALHRWDRGAAWLWVLQHEGAPVGLVQLLRQDHMLRLGFLLQSALWGRGLVVEAITALMQEAFRVRDFHRIEAVCDVDNTASQRVMVKTGMQYEGQLRRYILHPNVSPDPRDVLLYATVKE